MTSVLAERPANYEPPTSPMNAIGEGATPLMYACQQARDQEVRSILIKKPSAVRERDRTMKTALHYCAENTSLTCADLIVSAAPDLVDARDEDGYTPLHLAVIAGNRQLIKFLLAKNADVNCLDYERHSVVHWATVCGEVEALELVLDAGANPSTPDIHGGYPIHYAAQMCGPNSEMGNDVRFGLAVLRKLLAKGVEVNVRDKDGRQPILWAASAGELAAAYQRVLVHTDSSSSASCPSGSADAILALVNAGANVEADDKDGLTALHCAASRGHTDCLETLVTLCGAEVDVIDSNGCTALFYAVTLGHADSTQLLLSFGAEPNRQDRKGRTPAHCGAAKGQLETLRILGAHGANLWVRNVRGDYPLHEAVVSGRKDLVRWLLTQRPDAVNSPNNDGRCPLHIAAINNNVEMCKILLDGQALLNPVMRTSKGHLMTPIDAALHRGNRGCAKYLQLHGGVPASKLTDKAARLRGGTQRGAMSETQSEQYTTPEYAATLSLPGGRTSLGTSPLGDHETTRRIDNRTLQVRLNDDVAIRHVERIDAPVICTHHRYDDESSGEERMRRRRRRRRREHYVTHDIEEDSRRRRRGGRSDSADSEVRKRRRKRRDEEEYSDSGSERRTRRRWRGRRHSSDEDDEDDVIRDSNWVKNKKRRGERMKRRSKSKEESDDRSDVEYVRVRRTIVKSRKTKRKTVTDEEEEETQVEEESEEVSEEEVEEEVEDARGDNREVTKKTMKTKTETASSSKGKTKPRSKSNEESRNVTKAESQKSIKKEVSVERDNKKQQQSTGNKKQEAEQKASERSKSRVNKKIITKEKSIKKTTEAMNKDAIKKSSTKKTAKKGVKKIESGDTPAPIVIDKLVEQTTVEEKSLDEENGVTQTVVTAEVHQEGSQINMKSDTMEESSKEEVEKSSPEQSAETGQSLAEEEEEDKQKESTSDELSKNEEQNEEINNEKDAESIKITSSDKEVTNESEETIEKSEIGENETQSKFEENNEEMLGDESSHENKIEKDEIMPEVKVDNGEEPNVNDNAADIKPEEAEQNEREDEVKAEDKETKTEKQEEEEEEEEKEDLKSNNAEMKKEEETEYDVKNEPVDENKIVGNHESENDFDVKAKDEEEKEEKAESEMVCAEERAKEQDDETKVTTEEESAETKSEDKDVDESKMEEEKDKTEEEEEKLENEKSEEADAESGSDDKARSEQVEGPPTDDEAQELEHDSVTESSPIDKEEATGNAESGASTARSRNGGDSSVLLDSGFEPSPRRDKSSTTSSKQQTRSARGVTRGGRGRGRIPRPCRTDDEQPLTTVSVTQAVQNSMRKYQLERRIFQELLELKRLQIRAGRANEQVLVKRLVDDYHKAGLTVGIRQYDGVYTFRNFEKYLYDQLRLLQSSDRRLVPRLKSSDDLEKLTAALKRARFNSAYLDDVPDNPILCTHGTHRCHHAAHAYTGIPCAAYITKLNHHHVPKSGVTKTGSTSRGFLPRIDSSSSAKGRSSSGVPRSLRYVDPSRPVTLELSHGSDKQVISLPTERLDRNKRYYVTFTIKGGSKDDQKTEGQENAEDEKDLRHRHAKSL